MKFWYAELMPDDKPRSFRSGNTWTHPCTCSCTIMYSNCMCSCIFHAGALRRADG